MSRWQSYEALAAVLVGSAANYSKHKKARALRFTFKHRGAHRKVIAELVASQEEHAARRDHQCFTRAVKRAHATPDKPRHTDPLPWTRRGKRLAKQKKARTIHPVPAQRDH